MRAAWGFYFLCYAFFKVEASNTSVHIEKNSQDDGQACVINGDCVSKCCVHAHSVSGICMERAPIGLVCGFVLSKGTSVRDHYQLCKDCEQTFCCCGGSCCPTSYCVAVLDLKPTTCAKCNTGCCCNDDTCCPVQYCAPGILHKVGTPCEMCPSGCCCSDGCCLTTYCKGSPIGQYCQTCASGCCCGNQCCAASFCDNSELSITRLMMQYGGTIPRPLDVTLEQLALAFPKPMDVQEAFARDAQQQLFVIPPMLNVIPRRRLIAYPCPCETGCCCGDSGCCSHIYCI